MLLHIFAHIQTNDGISITEHLCCKTFGKVCLAHSGWPNEHERAYRLLGILQSYPAALYGSCYRCYGFILSYDLFLQCVLEHAQTFVFLLTHSLQRYPRHLAHHISNYVFIYLQTWPMVIILPLLFMLLQFGLQSGYLFLVINSQFEVPHFCSFHLLLLHVIYLLFQRCDYLWHRLILNVQTTSCFVHSIDGFIGETSGIHKPVREFDTCFQCSIRVTYIMEVFVTIPEVLENLKSFFRTGWLYLYLLETSLQSAILLYALLEFVCGGGTYALKLSTCKGRLQDVGSIHRTFCITSSHDGMYLINEDDDVRIVFQFCTDGTNPLFKLSAVLGACHHASHIQHHYTFVP